MAKLTWLGEDAVGVAGPSFTTAFGGIHFPKGEPVEVNDRDMIKRAGKNQFFKVEEDFPLVDGFAEPTNNPDMLAPTPHRRPGRPSNAERAAAKAAED